MNRKAEQFRTLVTGSHGVGKTTLITQFENNALSRLDVGVVPETARILASKGYSVNDEISVDGIYSYITTYEMNFRNTQNALLIADRGIMDLYFYTKHIYGKDNRLNKQLGDMVLELAKSDLRRYDLVVFVPIEFSMESDDVRPADSLFQREIEDRARSFLENEKIQFVTTKGDLQERTNRLHEAINNGIQSKF